MNRFERKIKKMTEEQVDAYIEELFENIENKNIAEVTAVNQQMEIINKIRFN